MVRLLLRKLRAPLAITEPKQGWHKSNFLSVPKFMHSRRLVPKIKVIISSDLVHDVWLGFNNEFLTTTTLDPPAFWTPFRALTMIAAGINGKWACFLDSSCVWYNYDDTISGPSNCRLGMMWKYFARVRVRFVVAVNMLRHNAVITKTKGRLKPLCSLCCIERKVLVWCWNCY